MRILVRPRARRDIEAIWSYSSATWGIDRAKRYMRRLQTSLELLARDPRLGRTCNDVRPLYRKYPSGSHLIFYRPLTDGIDVVRILHERMNFGQHL